MSASSRSWVSASSRIGRAPSVVTKRSTSSTRDASLVSSRREEPRRAVEEVGRRARGATGRAAGEWMARNEARVVDVRARLRFVDPTSVTVVSAGAAASTSRVARRGPDRHRDDDELDACHGLGERPRPLERPRAGGFAKGRLVGVPAGHPRHPGTLRRERDRGSEQARPDHRERRLRRAAAAARRAARGGFAACLLLHHVEHGGEKCLHSAL